MANETKIKQYEQQTMERDEKARAWSAEIEEIDAATAKDKLHHEECMAKLSAETDGYNRKIEAFRMEGGASFTPVSDRASTDELKAQAQKIMNQIQIVNRSESEIRNAVDTARPQLEMLQSIERQMDEMKAQILHLEKEDQNKRSDADRELAKLSAKLSAEVSE